MTVITFRLTNGEFFDEALDNIATELSQFTKPNIPELLLPNEDTLKKNLVECTLGVFSGPGREKVRFLMTNLVHKIFSAADAYRNGRIHALEYASEKRRSIITPYFKALSSFETCLNNCWQACEIWNYAANGKEKVFVKGDGSKVERLYSIYTIGFKHPTNVYDVTNHGKMPTSIWLTNEGIKCLNNKALTFAELKRIIVNGDQVFYQVLNKFKERTSILHRKS